MAMKCRHVQRVQDSFGENKRITLLGHHSDNIDQLPTFSMIIRNSDRFLHHNFVYALLNDLFEVQVRGSC